MLMEKHREKNKTMHMVFLDLEKAFDRVPHELIWRSTENSMVSLKHMSNGSNCCTKTCQAQYACTAGLSPLFQITVGVHQGSALSPLLFILCMDTATADLQMPHPWCLLYADDVVLADKDRLALQEKAQAWKDRLMENGLRLNIKKTEYLECGQQTDGTISIDGIPLNKVTEFKYLGSVVSADSETLPDAKSRVSAAWMKWRQVTGVLCDKRMPRYLKAKVYKAVVRPVAMYGSECWPATAKHEQSLHTMEMKML